MAVRWDYFDKFEAVTDKYMPARGEGETIASQAVTAVNKLVYKWYNDGDVFDNRFCLSGWVNDLSSYANWLWSNLPQARDTLARIQSLTYEGAYEDLLKDLADIVMQEDFLKHFEVAKVGSIYKCEGPFKYEEPEEEDEWDEEDC